MPVERLPRRRWILVGIFVVFTATVTTSKGDSYPTVNQNAPSSHDRCNPLRYEDQERRWRQRRRLGHMAKRDVPQQQKQCNQNSVILASSFSDGPPSLVNRWLKYRTQKGTIMIELEHKEPGNDPGEGLIEISSSKIEPNKQDNVTTTIIQQTIPSHSLTIISNNIRSKISRQLLPTLPTQYSALSPPIYPSNVKVSISISPSSLFQLAFNLAKASVGFVGAFGATLRLLAPMIVARRVLTTVGIIGYDYYYGRYLRTTYKKHAEWMEVYEIPSAVRACGRMGLQLITMMMAGALSRWVLHRAPRCFLPAVACRYLFGSVWVISVLMATWSVHFWMKKYPTLRLQTVEETSSDVLFSAATFFTRPWHILQWMKDPETWLLNLTRLQRHPNTHYNKYHRRRRDFPPFQPDPLLFPSTWPPLILLSGMAMVHAIAQTLPIKTGANTRILMQDFCLAVTILDEWKRVFLYERRITLGVVWSALSFAAFFVLASSAAIEVGWISATFLLPMGLACLVSGWMNTVLYSERYVQNI